VFEDPTILDLASTRARDVVESDLFRAGVTARLSIEQFGIVRRLHAFEISWRKRRGYGEDAGIRGSACGGCGHVDRLSA
jgi:hypothetical protein